MLTDEMGLIIKKKMIKKALAVRVSMSHSLWLSINPLISRGRLHRRQTGDLPRSNTLPLRQLSCLESPGLAKMMVNKTHAWAISVHLKLKYSSYSHIPANTSPSPNVGAMLGQRRRRWPNITPTLGERQMLTGIAALTFNYILSSPDGIRCQISPYKNVVLHDIVRLCW